MDSIHSIRKEIVLHQGLLIYWQCLNYEPMVKVYGKKPMERREIATMLGELGYSNFPFKHTDKGQPYLENSDQYLSISHSKGWFTLAISAAAVGVDIEPIRTSIEKGKSYFLNESDSRQSFSLEELHVIWGAKEAIFKQLNGAISNLKQEVSVIEINAKTILLDYQQQPYRFEYLFIQEVCLVWSI